MRLERGRRPVWRCAGQRQINRASSSAPRQILLSPTRILSILCPYCSVISSHARRTEARWQALRCHAIVAAGFHPEVLTTLTANRRALALPVVAAVAGSRDRTRLAELLGVAPVPSEDLRSGYLPEQAYGRAATWFSTLKRTWVDPRDLP